jgi:sulfate permease, SulP family
LPCPWQYTALHALTKAEENLREHGIALWLTALNPEAYKVVMRSALGRALGPERMFFNLGDAVAAFEKSRPTV